MVPSFPPAYTQHPARELITYQVVLCLSTPLHNDSYLQTCCFLCNVGM